MQEVLLQQMYFRQVAMYIEYARIWLPLDKNKHYALDKRVQFID